MYATSTALRSTGMCLMTAKCPLKSMLLRSSWKLVNDQLWVTAELKVFGFATWGNTVSFTANNPNYGEMLVTNVKGIMWVLACLQGPSVMFALSDS